MKLAEKDLKDFLEEKTELYNRPTFIESDPISIPHQFTRKEDIEIAAFFTATISWGQRTTILKNANRLTELMGNEPHQFILNAEKKDLQKFEGFVHQTFQYIDVIYFIR